MTLDEAIKHAEEEAKEQDKLCKRYDDASGYSRSYNEAIRTTNAKRCEKCAEEHRQLAEWLKDYKRLKEREPCGDAISRQAVLAIAGDSCLDLDSYEDTKEFCDIIKELPPVTPQPKTGHWIYDTNIENWRCSKCGETPKTMGYCGTADFMAEHFKYCNHCGIRMVEPQEGGDQE